MAEPIVGVYRNTHGRPSEPFIRDQAGALRRHTPMMLGRDAVPRTRAHVNALREHSTARYVGFRAGLRSAAMPFLRDQSVALVHAHFGADAAGIAPAVRAAALPLVVTLHGYDVTRPTSWFLRSARPALMRYGVERSRFLARQDIEFVAVSRYVADRAVTLGADPARVRVIPTGVDTARLLPSTLPDAARIVHVARLVEVKGTVDLIDALPVVRRSVPTASLDIVGDGPLRAALEARAGYHGLADAVRFHGPLTHEATLAVVGAARVACTPSITVDGGAQEALGQVVLEAMALGRPVVATRTGGLVEIVDDGRTGLLVSERSPVDLAEGLVAALDAGATGFADGLARAARHDAEFRFDLHRQASIVEDVYDHVRGPS
jgi:colanic acid/amylovoran biosynthesis glycosyltransferase